MSNNEIPEILEANVLKAVNIAGKDGKLIVNDVNVINRIISDETRIAGLESFKTNHTRDIIDSPIRFHLRENDIETLNSVKNKANKSELETIKNTVNTFTAKVNDKADADDFAALEAKAVTYILDENYPSKKIIQQNNVMILNNDFTITNGNINMVNGFIYLDSSCSNIVGQQSYVSIKDLNANNLITATGNGSDGSKGDVIVNRGEDGVISLWDHTHNNTIHITQEERNKWNNNSTTSFVIVPGDEEGKPVVEEKNQNIIYLVLIPDSIESTVNYTKWIWIKQPDETMNWEKIGSASIDLSEYAKITYVNNKIYEVTEAIETHAANTILHITDAERTKWNNYENFIATNAENIAVNAAEIEALKAPHFKIVDVLPETGETNIIYLVPKAGGQEKNIKEEYIYIVEGSIGKWEKIGDTEIDLSEYATKEQLNEHTINELIHVASTDRLAWNNKVDRSGDTMTGTLNFSTGYIKMPFANVNSLDGHILLGGAEADKTEYIDVSSSYIEITSENTETPNAINRTMLSSDYIICEIGEFNSEGEIAPRSISLIEKNGNIIASTSVNSNTLSAYSGNTITSTSNFKIVNSAGLFVNTVQPTSGNKVLFTKIGGEIDVTVSGTSKMTEDAPIVQITSNEDKADVIISGESVYDHIKNPHLHLTDEQINVLNAAEQGYFIYKPSEPDPSRPDEPYKGVNPKLILKNTEETGGYREATLQVDYDTGSSVELKKNNSGAYTAVITNGNHTTGSKLEINDTGVLIASSYIGPASISPNAKTTIMGDTSIGDSTTNYTLSINGKPIISNATGIPITQQSSTTVALVGGNAVKISGSSITITPANITDKIIKSTILFKPTTNVVVESLFTGDTVDNVICHEAALTANKLSIIEITQINTRRNKLYNS